MQQNRIWRSVCSASIALSLCCTLFGACSKPKHYDEVNTDIAAAVNGEFIHLDELRSAAQAYEDADEAVFNALLDAAIEERVLLQQAESLGLSDLTTDERAAVNRSVSEERSARYDYFYALAQEDHPDATAAEWSDAAAAAVADYVAQSGDTDEALLADYTNQTILEKLSASVTAEISITEDEVRALYDQYVQEDKALYTAHPEYYASDKSTNAVYYNLEGYRYIKHILVSTQEEAEAVAALAKTQDFNALIAQHSTDSALPGAYPNGFAVSADCDLYIDGFVDAAMALSEEGEISPPIALEDGYHILKYEKSIPAGAEPFEDARENIAAIALSEKQEEAYRAQVARWREQADIDIFQEVYQTLFSDTLD